MHNFWESSARKTPSKIRRNKSNTVHMPPCTLTFVIPSTQYAQRFGVVSYGRHRVSRRAQYSPRQSPVSYGRHWVARRAQNARRLDVMSYERAQCVVWTPSGFARKPSIVWTPSGFTTCTVRTTKRCMSQERAH